MDTIFSSFSRCIKIAYHVHPTHNFFSLIFAGDFCALACFLVFRRWLLFVLRENPKHIPNARSSSNAWCINSPGAMHVHKKAKEHTADLSMLIIIHRLRTIFYYLPFPHLWKCVLRVHHCSEASKDTFFTMINHTKCVHHVALLFPLPGPPFFVSRTILIQS